MRCVLFLRAPDLGELLERDNAGLVCHEVLAVTHDAYPERCALDGYRCTYDQLDGFVFEYLLLTPCCLSLRKRFEKVCEQVRFFRVDCNKLSATPDDRAGLAGNMAMVESDH